MLTLDTIRAALATPDPYAEMDRLVREEMAGGRKVKEIFDTIAPLTDSVLDTPGLTEHGEEAFLGTLDALTGNCDPDQWYEDPPNNTLPTEGEIGKLPRWARLAWVARCARRVLPLFLHGANQIGSDKAGVIRQAVERTEQTAAGNSFEEDVLITNQIEGGALAGILGNRGQGPAAHAAAAAGYAISADHENRSAALAIGNAVLAGEAFGITAYFRRDFDHLANLAHWRHWTDDTPVPPEVFGPLWPEGPPPGWPADPDLPQRTDLALELLSRARVLERMTEDEAVNLFNMINAYYIARTGDRLTIEDLRPYLPAVVPAEV